MLGHLCPLLLLAMPVKPLVPLRSSWVPVIPQVRLTGRCDCCGGSGWR
jgi:hypothetical protein